MDGHRSCPSSSAVVPGAPPCSGPQIGGERYAVLVGLFRDEIDAHLTRLAWVLGIVWAAGLVTTVGARLLAGVQRARTGRRVSRGAPRGSPKASSLPDSIRRSGWTKSAR